MKSIIYIILPIALAVILPVLNFFSSSNTTQQDDFSRKWFYGSLILYVLWYILFYASKWFDKNRTFYLVLTILLSIGFFYVVGSLTFFKNLDSFKMEFITKLISASIIFVFIQYAIETKDNLTITQLQKQQIESENYKIQLHELRIKVEPHFLFNSLNTLRSMIRKGNPDSESFVMNLSNFYRQTLKLHNSPTTKLSDELDILKSYFFLMQNRNENALQIEIDIKEELLNKELPTLSLQILAENCFKHNRFSALEPLKILVSTEDEGYILMRNNKQTKFTISDSTGFGIHNIKKRYALLEVNDGVVLSDSEESFEVQLKLI